METHHGAGLWSGSWHQIRCIEVMGGTSDPIHHRYLVTALEVQVIFGLDGAIFAPIFTQPFKLGHTATPAEHRYLMVVVVMASNPRFSVSRVDTERGTTTYTVDTLWDLHGVYQNSELFFIAGADAIADIMRRKDIDRLFELAHFVGVTRPGAVLDSGSLPAQWVSLVEIPAMVVSSTDCRSGVKSYQPVWYPAPDGVVQYVVECGLYQDPDLLVSSAKTAEDCESTGVLKFREEAPK